jgi:hypothetical protein
MFDAMPNVSNISLLCIQQISNALHFFIFSRHFVLMRLEGRDHCIATYLRLTLKLILIMMVGAHTYQCFVLEANEASTLVNISEDMPNQPEDNETHRQLLSRIT